MFELVFATNNEKKLKEVREIFSNNNSICILSLQDAGIIDTEIPEDFFTFQENAYQKASFIFQKTQKACIADDSGLEIEALNGDPGVFSARYAGEPKNDKNNIIKVLKNLNNIDHRKAQFTTVIHLISNQHNLSFEGCIKGEITNSPIGESGFGYDPIFIPNGHKKTFAEMTSDEKNAISHRKQALEKLFLFLTKEICRVRP